MPHHSEQKKLLEKILSSKEFQSSRISQTYLTYLVEATQNKKELKETTIAQEVFDKDESFNPVDDTIVRSHTYHLRKKLESYYNKDGKEDLFRLEIPKGRYEATFTPLSESPTFKANFRFLERRNARLVIIIILFAAAVLLWGKVKSLENTYQLIDRDDPVWRDYLQSKLPVLLVVGNHFIFDDYVEDYDHVVGIRHGKVNSPEDFEKFKSDHPNSQAYIETEPYFPYHSVWSLPPILSLFFSVNEKPILRKSSAVTPQMLDEYNIIFVGSIKTLYCLRHTLDKSHFDFEISPHKIRYSPPDSSTANLFAASLHSPGPNDDLVLALKLPGPKNNAIMIIASFHSLGAAEVANYLVESDTREYLEDLFSEKYGPVPRYFETLFRVRGIDNTAYSTEILVYNEIEGH